MVPSIREEYNRRYTPQAYEAFLQFIETNAPGQLEFRVAETPFFVSAELRDKILEGAEALVDFVCRPDIKDLTEGAIPASLRMPNEGHHPHYLCIDFAICDDGKGGLIPQLIEMQGFPSLFAFQNFLSKAIKRHLYVPEGYTYIHSGLTEEQYVAMLKKTILGSHAPEDVVLLEIEPEKQKTRIDFYATKMLVGVDSVCITKVYARDGKLYRTMADGSERQVKRIYNRVIFDELEARPDIVPGFDLTKPYDVEWTGHPNWFFRISKYILPMLDHWSVPRARRLSEFRPGGAQLSKYVLKPLFSFAGQGVVIDVTPADLDAVKDPENWILQEKVQYKPCIITPDGASKVELRLLYLWPDGDARPTLCTNLVRLSQGLMSGVRYNKDKTWVGSSTAFFQV